MRGVVWNKISRQIFDHTNMLSIVEKMHVGSIRKQKKNWLLQNIRAFNLDTQMGQDGTDFRDDKFTIVTRFNLYRIPRFIRNTIINKPHNRNRQRQWKRVMRNIKPPTESSLMFS